MGASIQVDSQNFAVEVVERSYEQPVLVDFFAQWCGPCKMLKPILEKLSQEYNFVLAQIDIDQNPDLAHTYQVEGVPDVRIALQGELFNGFVGMLPEADLRELLAQLSLKSELVAKLQAAEVAINNQDWETAGAQYEELLQRYPEERQVLIEAAQFFIQTEALEAAETLLEKIPAHEKAAFRTATALKGLIQMKRDLDQPVIEHELDEDFFRATRLTLAGDYEAALEHLLDLVRRDRKYRNDGARKAMLLIFDLLGDEDPLTRTYRKQLMQSLY